MGWLQVPDGETPEKGGKENNETLEEFGALTWLITTSKMTRTKSKEVFSCVAEGEL